MKKLCLYFPNELYVMSTLKDNRRGLYFLSRSFEGYHVSPLQYAVIIDWKKSQSQRKYVNPSVISH